MRSFPTLIFACLCFAFLMYTASIYMIPARFAQSNNSATIAADGKLVWQKYNCQSCHQLYGLGGYLGPDLTNVYDKKGPHVIQGILASGNGAMPAFELSQTEQANLLHFLKQISATGSSDYRTYATTPTGMIELP